MLREPGSGTRSVFEEAMAHLGLNSAALRVCLELPSNEAVRSAVEAGMGATALSASVAAPSIESGLLQQVDFRLPERCFQVLQHRERYRTRAADALLSIILINPRFETATRLFVGRIDNRSIISIKSREPIHWINL